MIDISLHKVNIYDTPLGFKLIRQIRERALPLANPLQLQPLFGGHDRRRRRSKKALNHFRAIFRIGVIGEHRWNGAGFGLTIKELLKAGNIDFRGL